ncbi:metallophosphoesterase family protein [Cognatishimia sp. F0-27]|uniref:metallophosphoesterase family protein n=1 Tax=Cognatishimia sp. F0-27 TaxID=2816855 RepID=UPI001D0C4F41
MPFYAVGDLHGCDALLGTLLDKLEEAGHPDAKLVTVGDYVDRGEQSAAVLRRLCDLQSQAGDNMICLKGNHEDMMLAVLDDPVQAGPRWLRHGGLQTLASFRVPPPIGTTDAQAWITMRDALRDAMTPTLEDWLRALPLSWQTGNVVVTHAGADPAKPIDQQRSQVLLWGHPSFETIPRNDGLWIVHGHTITDTPRAVQGRIATDTGAYATGRLTCALIETESVSFIRA